MTSPRMALRVLSLYAGGCLLLPVLGSNAGAAAGAAKVAGAPPRLEEILGRLAGLSRLYRDSALRFSCEETIATRGVRGKPCRLEYIYVYDDAKGFKDHRVDRSKKGGREVDPATCGAPQFLRRAYSWVFLFGDPVRKRYRYALEGEGSVLSRPAVRVRFEPDPAGRTEPGDWFGTAWVDRDTQQILKVEALNPEQHARQREFESEIPNAATYRLWGRRKVFLIERVTTIFSVEKNGMRFPGSVEIDLSRYEVPGNAEGEAFQRSTVYRVRQSYSGYRFFNVRTAEEIRGIAGGAPAAGDR